MESKYEDMTKEQLIAELNVAKEKNNHLRDRIAAYKAEDGKREFERKLVEAKEFLMTNGYEIRPMTAAERFPVEQTFPGAVQVRKPERIWKDTDMKSFAGLCFFGPTQSISLADHIKAQLELYAERKKYQP